MRCSLYRKILIIFIPLFLISYIFLSVSLTNIVNKFYHSQLKQSMQTQNNTLATQIDSVFEDISTCAFKLMQDLNDSEMKSFLLTNSSDDVLYNRIKSTAIKQLLYETTFVYPCVESIGVCDIFYQLYGTELTLSDYWNTDAITLIQSNLKKYGTKDTWYPLEKRSYLTNSSETVSITMGKKISDIMTGKFLGYIYINVDEKTITDIYQPSENEYSTYYILDEYGKIVSSSNKNLIFSEIPNDLLGQYYSQSQTQFEYNIDGNGFIISLTPLKYNHLYLINVTDTAALSHASESIVLNILIVFLSTLIILIFLTAVFSKKIVLPLKNLTQKMRAEDIIRSETIEMEAISSPDEIEELTIHFKQMISKINQTFDNLKQSEKQKRKTQFALIQEQIKPHFLYNSLDAIYILNYIGKHEEANKATKALADFYRSCLANGNEIVTLKQELDTVTNYMLIQQYRHVDTFSFSIKVDECYYDYLIPKLSLQPIIENALYHGFRTQKKTGNIQIYCYEEDQYFYIVVRDDGVGMDQKDANLLLEHADSGFGLYSISSRLKLYFDEKCGIQIHSHPGQGTEVQLKILKCKGEINDDNSN